MWSITSSTRALVRPSNGVSRVIRSRVPVMVRTSRGDFGASGISTTGNQGAQQVLARASTGSSGLPEYAYDPAVLKAAGIDIAANEFTAIVHFRGTW